MHCLSINCDHLCRCVFFTLVKGNKRHNNNKQDKKEMAAYYLLTTGNVDTRHPVRYWAPEGELLQVTSVDGVIDKLGLGDPDEPNASNTYSLNTFTPAAIIEFAENNHAGRYVWVTLVGTKTGQHVFVARSEHVGANDRNPTKRGLRGWLRKVMGLKPPGAPVTAVRQHADPQKRLMSAITLGSRVADDLQTQPGAPAGCVAKIKELFWQVQEAANSTHVAPRPHPAPTDEMASPLPVPQDLGDEPPIAEQPQYGIDANDPMLYLAPEDIEEHEQLLVEQYYAEHAAMGATEPPHQRRRISWDDSVLHAPPLVVPPTPEEDEEQELEDEEVEEEEEEETILFHQPCLPSLYH
jgi:hypothetical protein